jgi:hypothetical protein
VQKQLLDQYPSEQVRVYAVWLPMLAGDSREEWNGTTMPDARATHFWDGELQIGEWFAKQVDGYDGVAWIFIISLGPMQYGKLSHCLLWVQGRLFMVNASSFRDN